ncbi:MAG: hypothetical protein K1000chlam2_01437 [Chlamydiae bacterium]|nr:hypothetical protein [Chlamydiota bacterium]
MTVPHLTYTTIARLGAETAIDATKEAATKAGQNIKAGLATAGETIKTGLKTASENIKPALNTTGDFLKQVTQTATDIECQDAVRNQFEERVSSPLLKKANKLNKRLENGAVEVLGTNIAILQKGIKRIEIKGTDSKIAENLKTATNKLISFHEKVARNGDDFATKVGQKAHALTRFVLLPFSVLGVAGKLYQNSCALVIGFQIRALVLGLTQLGHLVPYLLAPAAITAAAVTAVVLALASPVIFAYKAKQREHDIIEKLIRAHNKHEQTIVTLTQEIKDIKENNDVLTLSSLNLSAGAQATQKSLDESALITQTAREQKLSLTEAEAFLKEKAAPRNAFTFRLFG